MAKNKNKLKREKDEYQCPFAEGCRLPENNSVYLWHLGFLVICWFVLCLDPNQLTPFSILMFVVPSFIDLTRTGAANKHEKLIRGVLIAISAIFIVISIILLRPEIKITPLAITVPTTSAIFAGLLVNKAFFAKLLSIEFLVPLYLLFTTPTKKFHALTVNESEG